MEDVCFIWRVQMEDTCFIWPVQMEDAYFIWRVQMKDVCFIWCAHMEDACFSWHVYRLFVMLFLVNQTVWPSWRLKLGAIFLNRRAIVWKRNKTSTNQKTGKEGGFANQKTATTPTGWLRQLEDCIVIMTILEFIPTTTSCKWLLSWLTHGDC